MHIPDGMLSGQAAGAGWVVAVAGLTYCARRAKGEQRERDLPIAGLAAAFFLVGDAPLFPVGVGTQGHLLGGALAVALLGPWLGAICIAVVCGIQAIALSDGGVTTLGLTIVNLALLPALVGYPVILTLRRILPPTPRAVAGACAAAAFACVVLSSVLFVGFFAVGATIDLKLGALAGTTIGTYAVVAVVEATITFLVIRALLAVRPDLVRVAGPLRERRRREAVARLKASQVRP